MQFPARWSLRGAALFSIAAVTVTTVVGLSACEDAMGPAEAQSPATMPRAPEPAASAGVPETVAVEVIDAGPPADGARHAVLVTACSIDKRGCLLAQPSSPPGDASYRVVLGGGLGAIRTRGQAMAELYKEIRDRTTTGSHLAAEPHHIGDPPASAEGAKAAPRPAAGLADDPLVEAAFQLMDVVDHDGEVTIDSLPMRSPNSCQLSMASLDSDAGAGRCLVNAPAPTVIPTRRGR